VARTDVPLPHCCRESSGGGGAPNNNEENSTLTTFTTSSTRAKVFAVFDGHGGAEVARFCQMHLVPTLTSHAHWDSTKEKKAGVSDINNNNGMTQNLAYCIGQSLIESFHALDRLIDDPDSRMEIERWRSEVPPPYVHNEAGKEPAPVNNTPKEESTGEGQLQTEDLGDDEAQQRRHTIMDPAEMAEDVAKLHLLDDGDDDESEDSEGGEDDEVANSTNDKEGGTEEQGGDTQTGDKNIPNGTNNTSNLLDEDDDDEVFEDSLSEPAEDDNLDNKDADGVINDDSDDEKAESSNKNDNDDGEVEAVSSAPSEGKEQGTMVLSANDAVALFQKLLHMNGPSEENDDEDDSNDDQAKTNGEKMNGEANEARGESGDGGGEEGKDKAKSDVVIPTKAQLLNPPTGIVPQSASVPTRIQNGRKICNLPDHPVHAGCTAVVAVIVGNTLIVANAGDSRAVICRAGGLTEPLSFDHKPLQNREMNRITNAGGFVNQFGRVNGNLNLSRSIGDLKYKQVPGIPPAEQMITAEPDILSTNLRKGDEFIVLGCDGIWDCLSNEECVKYVRDRINNKHPHEIGMEMLDEIVSADPRASQGIGGDNMTIMIVDLLPHSRPYNDG